MRLNKSDGRLLASLRVSWFGDFMIAVLLLYLIMESVVHSILKAKKSIVLLLNDIGFVSLHSILLCPYSFL